MNFSPATSPTAISLGCVFGNRCIDVSRAIAAGALAFPQQVATIEETLRIPGGLETLENGLLELATAPPEKYSAFLFDAADVLLHAPVMKPQKLIGIGLNYRDHAQETGMELPKEPLLFAMYANAVVGPNQPIVIPSMSEKIDYEAELAVVIGARARRVAPADALQYVAGYTIVHDVSARDLQRRDGQWLRAKSFDTFAPMGPCMATRRELGDADGLSIRLRRNGVTLQDSNTANLIFKVPALVSHISQVMTLEPGDVISTGTPPGVGYVRKPPIYLQPGDTVEIEIEGIGVLRNPVVGSEE